jgi:uncharacterized protein (TIGR03086 family)
MTPFDDLDTAALALIACDVAQFEDTDLSRPTPCTGWDVADLLQHMNDRHDAISRQFLASQPEPSRDPRRQFAVSAAAWTLALAFGADRIRLPGLTEPVPRDQVRAVHFIDMLTHRWDLAQALGRANRDAEELAEAALPIARTVTAPGSALVGTAYQPSRHQDDAGPATDRLAALLGRDPAWSPNHLDAREHA